jgi:hypothetical protein
LPGVARSGFEHQKVNIAVFGHLSRSGGTEQDYSPRLGYAQNAFDDFSNQCLTYSHKYLTNTQQPGQPHIIRIQRYLVKLLYGKQGG